MRIILFISFLFLNLGCATTYHLELAPKVEQLNSFRLDSTSPPGQTNYLEREDKGNGWSIGLIETTKYFFAKFNYSQVNYTQIDSNGFGTFEVENNYANVDLALGVNLAFLKPYLVSSSRLIQGGDEPDRFAGAGLRVEIPFTENTKISIDYSNKTRIYEDSSRAGPEDELQALYIGFMFGNWQTGNTNKRNKP